MPDRKPDKPPRIEGGRDLQQQHAGAVLLQVALHRHDLVEVFAPDIDAVEPAGRAEQHERGRGGRRDDAPAPGEHEHHRQQQAELRLDGEDAEQHAGEQRPPVQIDQAADQQRGEEKAVLAEEQIDRDRRRDRDEQKMLALDAAGRRGSQEERQSRWPTTRQRPPDTASGRTAR